MKKLPIGCTLTPLLTHTLIYPETCPIMQMTNLEGNEVIQHGTPFPQMQKKEIEAVLNF